MSNQKYTRVDTLHKRADIELNEIICIEPKTRHARNRRAENGGVCKVTAIKGSRICVQHLDNTDAWRWIEINNDQDWQIFQWGK